MGFCAFVADLALDVLVVALEAGVVCKQLVVLLLQVELVAVGDFLVCVVFLVAVAFDAQRLVFVVEVVEARVLVLDF